MKPFTAQTFTIPALKGISAKTIEEHLKLYQGYVKNANTIFEKIDECKKDSEKNAYALGELMRRFSFEFNGMRNHEAYFASLQGGAAALSDSSQLRKLIAGTWGSFDAWLMEFKALGLTRGIGWAVLWYDNADKRLLNSWVDEQHLGQLQNCTMILGMDMWEHSYVADYQPSGKKNYIEDFFNNLNWSVIEQNFQKASGASL
ncbi:MAG: manganese/iron superoxide dismutase-like protein superoxide dismutase, Fe-Mn family [Candidatus Parcubacteria bacterium]|nr:manganese/iron superoxide dismutase-like protein superoxide dismutase, Fe-Mn family [Candidatus Parcubacteria bacterium]